MIHMILKVKVLTYVAHTRCNDALHCAKDFFLQDTAQCKSNEFEFLSRRSALRY